MNYIDLESALQAGQVNMQTYWTGNVDDGIMCTITPPSWVTLGDGVPGAPIYVCSNSKISNNTNTSGSTKSNNTVNVNGRDARGRQCWIEEGNIATIPFFKISWKGDAHYNSSSNPCTWSVYWFQINNQYGTIATLVFLDRKPSSYWNGIFSFYAKSSYSLNNAKDYALYIADTNTVFQNQYPDDFFRPDASTGFLFIKHNNEYYGVVSQNDNTLMTIDEAEFTDINFLQEHTLSSKQLLSQLNLLHDSDTSVIKISNVPEAEKDSFIWPCYYEGPPLVFTYQITMPNWEQYEAPYLQIEGNPLIEVSFDEKNQVWDDFDYLLDEFFEHFTKGQDAQFTMRITLHDAEDKVYICAFGEQYPMLPLSSAEAEAQEEYWNAQFQERLKLKQLDQ